MMKNRLLLLLLGMALCTSLQAQQPAQYSLFMLNKYAYNNAYNGLDRSLSITGVFRKQWVNFPGSPLSVNFNAHMPLEIISSGIGIGVEYDALGAYSNLALRGSYSYIIDLKESGRLSIGLAGRMIQKELDGSRLLTPDGIYELGVNHNDPSVPTARVSGLSFSMDAAVYYQHDWFEIGVAAINLTQPSLQLANDASILYNRAYFFTATGKIPINRDFTIKPSFLLKSDFIKFQPEIAAILDWKDNIFGGVAFRGYNSLNNDAVVFLAGVKWNDNFTLAYAYDLSIGSLQGFNSGSHEVVLNYNLNKKIGKEIPSKVIYNPRFL
ncbi:MAG: PorP/SprF family type IX secretion system membrane protein [Aureispira sp.]